eukprot:NODE_232_length_13679_cov_0.197349.p5 type:complete len:350 gc:universal NODE_232_length_13679_cov_0.197349:10678-11727(+)
MLIKKNEYVYKRPVNVKSVDYSYYIPLLADLSDEKSLLKTIIKLKKHSRIAAPIELVDPLVPLLCHHNTHILLSVLDILASVVVFRPVPMNLVYPLIHHLDLRIQQNAWNLISSSLHDEECRDALLKMCILNEMKLNLKIKNCNINVLKTVLSSIYNLGYYISLPEEYSAIICGNLLSMQGDVIKFALLILAQIANNSMMVHEIMQSIHLTQLFDLIISSNEDIVLAGLKFVLSLTAGDSADVVQLLDSSLDKLLASANDTHHELVAFILTNVAHHNTEIPMAYLNKLEESDYELICVLIEKDVTLVPRIAETWIPILIANMNDPNSLYALKVIFEYGKCNKGNKVLFR